MMWEEMVERLPDLLGKLRIRQNSISKMHKTAEDEVAKAIYILCFEICEIEKLLISIQVTIGGM